MFAAVNISYRRSAFAGSKITSKRIRLPSGESFFTVGICCRRGRVPFKKLEGYLGILKRDVLLPESLLLPESSGITAFEPDIFPRLLLMSSATEHILYDSFSPGEELTVFDEKGIYAPFTERLVSRFSSIRIVTPFKEKYAGLSRRLLEEYGFSLVVTGSGDCRNGTVISYDCSVPIYFKGRVYTCSKKPLVSSQIFSGREIILPEEYERLLPENTDRLVFASALYEKCGVSELASLKFADFGS